MEARSPRVSILHHDFGDARSRSVFGWRIGIGVRLASGRNAQAPFAVPAPDHSLVPGDRVSIWLSFNRCSLIVITSPNRSAPRRAGLLREDKKEPRPRRAAVLFRVYSAYRCNSTDTLFAPPLPAAMSGRPSSLKSPTAMPVVKGSVRS